MSPIFKLVAGSSLFTLLLLAGCSGSDTPQSNANTPTVAPSPAAATSPAVTTAPKQKLNVNTASGAELLAAIPNLGNRMVHEFEEYRPYRSIQQFRREIGKYVSPAEVAEYEKYIFVPINPNDSDAATLQQIPGLDATEAQAMIAGRPYATPSDFLTKLGDKISSSDLEVARGMLTGQ